ncbi:MAG TPA: YeeE/YedE thiosulfate transporter family protein [Beijerinckiaceae bacterium]|nr:YeeE/YedE thiosulfate transporter family protein [Beijerinckiaceae bacterium]
MSVLAAMLLGLAMGIVFGFALEKGRVCEAGVIVCQMQMSRHAMLKMFLSAVITGLLVLAFLVGFGFAKLSPKATLFAADIIGGAILGIGIVVAGACPGTVLAQIGTGYKDAIFTFIGGLFGALAFTYAEPTLLKPILNAGSYGKLTLDQLLGVPFPALALGFAAVLAGLLIWLEKLQPWQEEIGPAGDGLPAEEPRRDAVPAPTA